MVLSIPGIRDRGYVQIGSVWDFAWFLGLALLKLKKKYFLKASIGVLYRILKHSIRINLPNNNNRTLYIIVENMGRLNFGNDLLDAKVF